VNVPEFLHESRDIKLLCSIESERREVTLGSYCEPMLPWPTWSKGVPRWSPLPPGPRLCHIPCSQRLQQSKMAHGMQWG